MNRTNHLICAHSGLLFAVMLGIGFFFVPGWFPPILPGMSADAVQAMFQEHRLAIRLGMTLTAFASVFWFSFSAAIAMQMKRIEGRNPILAWVQLVAASGNVMIIMFAAYFVLTAAYRPDTPATTIQAFNDIAWLMNIGCYPPGLIQSLAIGLCIITGRRDNGVYPRWLGYVNLWVAVIVIAGGLLPFFHGGPFSWNGVIGFWLEAVVFFSWINLMWWYTVKAIRTQPDA